MKKNLFLLAALALLAGCNNHKPNTPEKPADSKPEAFSVETYEVMGDRLYSTKGEGDDAYEVRGSFQCEIDIPVTENQALRDSICYWLASNFGSLYDGDPHDMKAMVNYYKNYSLDPGLDEDPEGFDMGYTVKMLDTTDRYVTYSFETFYEEYSSPRASVEIYYRTFDRNTGKAFSSQMIKPDASLVMLVMNAMLDQYFGEIYPNDDYSDLLFFDPDDLEERGFWLPQVKEPCLINGRVCFNYSEHEIADRCTGRPHCSLSYSEMKSYLTPEGQAFFE